MSLAAFLAWASANEAALATILLVISELLGSVPKVKANGFVSFAIIQAQKLLKNKGGVTPTP